MPGPGFEMMIAQCWGSVVEFGCSPLNWGSNIVTGVNPPYDLNQFFAMYPKFAGPATPLTGTLTLGSPTITAIAASGVVAGVLVSGAGIPNATYVSGAAPLHPNTVTLTQNATASASATTITFYTQPLVPIAVINSYLVLATASLVSARDPAAWPISVGYYIAHFLTLYLRSEGDCNLPAGAAAAKGLKSGVEIAANAGPVGQSLKAVPGIDDWAGWGQTSYGVSLVTQWGKVAGMGCSLLY